MNTKRIFNINKISLFSEFSAAALVLPLIIAIAAMLIVACGGGGGYGGTAGATYSSNQGTLHMSMTDAPACGFDQVNVTVNKVRVNQSSTASDTDSGWHDITLNPAMKINLLDLTNGVMTDLGQTALPAGHYTQIRLVLAANGSAAPWANSVVASGSATETALDTPSAIQSGIKLASEFDVAANTTTDLVLDFDACKSVVTKGNSGGFLLKPVIGVTPVTVSGSISGFVTPGLTNALVTVQQDGVVLKATVPDAITGSFTLSPVMANSSNYIVVFTADGHATGAISGVPVTAGSTTTLSTNTTAIVLPISLSHTVSGTITPLVAAGSARATQTFTTGSQKVEIAYKAADATTGAYSLSLPVASPLLGSFGTLPLVLTADAAIAGKYNVEAFATGYATQTVSADVSTSDVVKDFVLAP